MHETSRALETERGIKPPLFHIKPPSCDDRLIWDVFTSAYHYPALVVADEIGLFPLIERGVSTNEGIAENLGLARRGVEALLGLLASLGFLTKRDGLYYNTEITSNFLLPQSPFYWGHMFKSDCQRPASPAVLLKALKTDKPDVYEGMDLWKGHQADPQRAKAFTRGMHSHTFPAAIGVAFRNDFSGVKRLLDVGGGSGCFCIALALRYPDMQCTVVELPSVCEVTNEYVHAFGLQQRIKILALDMFNDQWPLGHDTVLFSNVLHDWTPPKCIHLCMSAFRALPSGGRVYIHELLLNDSKDGPTTPAAFSLKIDRMTEGQQFSATELHELLTGCGFDTFTAVRTFSYYWLISARKP